MSETTQGYLPRHFQTNEIEQMHKICQHRF